MRQIVPARRWAPLLPAFAVILGGCHGAAPAPPPPPPPSPDDVPVGHPPLAKPPANPVGGFSITLPSMTLTPGEEQTPCWIFPLTVDGPSNVVGGGSLTVGPGMHHGNITTRPSTGTGIRPCPPDQSPIDGEGADILAGGAVLFASSTQITGTEWQSFPEGWGYRLRDGFEIVARMHYLNPTAAAVTVAPKYQWYTIDEAALTQEIGPFAWTYTGFSIPPLSMLTVTASCNFPSPMKIISLLPHMHQLGTNFSAGFVGGNLDGKLFLDSKGYDPQNGVLTDYDPPGVDLSQGTGATFSCTWNNVLDQTIVEGIGVNEMCILFGYAYPPGNAFSTSATDAGCVYLAPPAPP